VALETIITYNQNNETKTDNGKSNCGNKREIRGRFILLDQDAQES